MSKSFWRGHPSQLITEVSAGALWLIFISKISHSNIAYALDSFPAFKWISIINLAQSSLLFRYATHTHNAMYNVLRIFTLEHAQCAIKIKLIENEKMCHEIITSSSAHFEIHFGFHGDHQQNAALFQCYVHFLYLEIVFCSCNVVVFCRK